MPVVPTREALGDARILGAVDPAQINAMVAYDIGSSSDALGDAFRTIGKAFATVAERKKSTEEDAWLTQAKLDTLVAEDEISRDVLLNAEADGAGLEEGPPRLQAFIKERARQGDASDELRQKYLLWGAQRAVNQGISLAREKQKRFKDFSINQIDSDLNQYYNRAEANPARADEYFNLFAEKVNSLVGKAIDATEAQGIIERGRQAFTKAKVTGFAKVNPADYLRAREALRDHRAKADPEGFNPKSENDPAPVTSSRSIAAPMNPAAAKRFLAQRRVDGNENVEDLEPTFAGRIAAMIDAAPPEIRDQIKIESGFRSRSHQARLFQRAIQKYGSANAAARNVAPPGRSQHNFGRAADLKYGSKEAEKWVHENARRFGLWFPMDYEPWHVEPVGSRGKDRVETVMPRETAPSEAIASRMRIRDLPKVDGPIQPGDIASLHPKDFDALDRDLRPYVSALYEEKVNNAIASIMIKGDQSIITDEELASAEGLLTKKAVDKWREAISDAYETYAIKETLKQLKPSERNEWISTLLPEGDPESASADELAFYSKVVEIRKKLEKALNDDPYGFVSRESQTGKTAQELIANASPNANGLPDRERAYDILLKAQRDMGVAEPNLSILPKGAAEQIAKELLSVKDGKEGVQKLQQLRLQYGRHFDRLWRELANAGAPNSFWAAQMATPRGQNDLIESYALERLFLDAAGKDSSSGEVLRKRAGVTEKDLSSAVSSETSEFVDALSGMNPLYQVAVQDAVRQVALKNMIVDRMDLDRAVNFAAEQIFKTTYTLLNGVIIPRQIYDEHDLALQRAMNRIGQLIERRRDDIDPRLQLDDRLSEVFQTEQYINSLKGYGRLKSSFADDGVYLIDHAGRRVMIKSPDGPRPWLITWDELIKLGKPSYIGELLSPTN